MDEHHQEKMEKVLKQALAYKDVGRDFGRLQAWCANNPKTFNVIDSSLLIQALFDRLTDLGIDVENDVIPNAKSPYESSPEEVLARWGG